MRLLLELLVKDCFPIPKGIWRGKLAGCPSPRNEKLLPDVQRYLEMCGLSQRKIRQCHMDTRMFHDLRFYGEIAEDCIEILRDKFHVNIDSFDFYRHFPPEFHENVFLFFVPFVRWLLFEKPDKYAPLTLEMIGRAITSKKLENSG